MRTYELMAIHRPEIAEDDVRAKVGDVESFVGEKGGTVTSTDLWGKRRFAYEINHVNEGYYSVLTFQADRSVVEELDRMLSLSDDVVRHKFVRPGT